MTKVIITVFRRAMQGKSKWDKSVDDIPYRYIGGTAASGTKVLTMFYRAMQGNKKKGNWDKCVHGISQRNVEERDIIGQII